jgi:hypothetical protein
LPEAVLGGKQDGHDSDGGIMFGGRCHFAWKTGLLNRAAIGFDPHSSAILAGVAKWAVAGLLRKTWPICRKPIKRLSGNPLTKEYPLPRLFPQRPNGYCARR